MEMWKTAALPMENPFTAYGKGQTLPHSLQTGFPQRRIHASLHTFPQRLLLRISILSFPIRQKKIKENNKKEREYSQSDEPRSCTPVLRYEKCVKISLYPCISAETGSHGKSQGHLLEKPMQEIILPFLNPYPCSFLSVWKGNGGRPPAPPGNSACSHGRSPGRPCYTAACRSHPKRKTIPAAISCSGS